MNKLPYLFLFFVLFSCEEKDTYNFEYGQKEYVYDRSGKQYDLDPNKIYCGPGFGRKFCRFLYYYEETIWADAENYYSDFSDIKFSGFADDLYFLSFLNLDSTTSYCKGWKLGETTYEGIKWNIELKKDEDDVLWFGYDYYGTSEEIEYSITYKYEVIDGLLHFSSSEGQTFIFHPSEKNYSEDSVETGELIFLEGCKFF